MDYGMLKIIKDSENNIAMLIASHQRYQNDDYNSMENHVSIAASICYSIIMLTALYIISSMTSALYEFSHNDGGRKVASDYAILIYIFSMLIVIFVSGFGMYFICRIKNSIKYALYKSHYSRRYAFRRYIEMMGVDK